MKNMGQDIERQHSQMTLMKTPAANIRLIEYMYFSIYTITTTGYGDIIPRTSYAKFVTAVSNFCEVFFLVVFFNALLSAKEKSVPRAAKRRKVSRGSKPDTAAQTAGEQLTALSTPEPDHLATDNGPPAAKDVKPSEPPDSNP
jgi:hypothetical protein